MKRFFQFFIMLLPFKLLAVSIEGKVSAFIPSSHHTREIYGDVWPDYGVTLDHMIFWKNLSFFASGDYLAKDGHSQGGHEKTHIRIIPVTLGLKWIQPINSYLDLYAGAGPRIFFVKVKNNSPYVPKEQKRVGVGGYFTGGAFFEVYRFLLVDLFVGYSIKEFHGEYKKDNLYRFSGDISGFDIGLGLVFNF